MDFILCSFTLKNSDSVVSSRQSLSYLARRLSVFFSVEQKFIGCLQKFIWTSVQTFSISSFSFQLAFSAVEVFLRRLREDFFVEKKTAIESK